MIRSTCLLLVAALVAACNGTSATGDAPSMPDGFAEVSAGPRVTAVEPPQGTAAGGTEVKVTGEGFAGAPLVRFGDSPALVKSWRSDLIVVLTPPGIAGAVAVEVTVGEETGVLESGFTYEKLALGFTEVPVDEAAVPGRQVVAVDVDRDGDLDLVQALDGLSNRLLVNTGYGKFVDESAVRMPSDSNPTAALAAADFDGDGWVDVVAGNRFGASDRLYLGDGAGALVPAPKGMLPSDMSDTRWLAAVDVDGDGKTDLVAAVSGEEVRQRVYRNTGDGALVDSTELALPQGSFPAAWVAPLDVDGEGDLDLLFGGDGAPSRLFLNDGTGVFGLAPADALPALEAIAGQRGAVGDLNGDGRPDVLLARPDNDIVWTNDGTGRFYEQTELYLGADVGGHVSAVARDMDLDGALDLVLVRSDGSVGLLRNDGSGRMFDYSATLEGNGPAWAVRHVAVGDLDGDGGPDIVLSGDGGPVRTLLSGGKPVGPVTPPEEYRWTDPWPVPQEEWSHCEEGPSTAETLAQKAAYYDWIVPRLHQSFGVLEDGRVIDYSHVQRVQVNGVYPKSIVPDEELPEVVTYISYGNAGLWTAKYAVSQAFRYAVTGEAEALENVRTSLTANYVNLKITGIPGYFARGYWPPLPGHFPPDPSREDKYGGYTLVEEGPYAGFTWKTDTSKDEYSGHLFAIGVVAKLVDDPGIQAMVKEMATEVGYHLRDHNYWITDEQGNPTTYGSVMAFSMDHIPAFNAVHALTWTLIAAQVSGDQELQKTYHNCLLQQKGEWACIDYPFEVPMPYTQHLEDGSPGMLLGCDTNYDNVGMMMAALFNLIWFEEDESRRDFYRRKLVEFTRGPDKDGYDLWSQANPWFNFLFAAMQPVAPDLQGRPNAELVHEAVCTLRRFPADKEKKGQSTLDFPEFCESERHGPLTDQLTPVELRCPRQFVWWTNPYKREECPVAPDDISPPQDFLLTYWMGRYFGFLDESL